MLKKLKCQKGQAIVELTLVLPIILIIVFLMLETGRFVYAAYEIEHASREAARLGAVGATDTEIFQRARDSVSGLSSSGLIISVTPGETTRKPGDTLVVVVSYQFNPITPFIGSLYPGGVRLSSDMAMRVE